MSVDQANEDVCHGQRRIRLPLCTIRKYLITGLLTAVPVWITWLAVTFLVELVIDLGEPLVLLAIRQGRPLVPSLADWLVKPVIQKSIALLFVIFVLIVLGWFVSRVIGQRIIGKAESWIGRVPLIKTIYGGVKKLIEAFQTKPERIQRVVLINFPSSEMKAVGLVTRTMIDEHTGQELAAVYVPTSPNPTAGFLEIIPIDDVIPTDWTVNEALNFVVSGGTVGPERVRYGLDGAVAASGKDT